MLQDIRKLRMVGICLALIILAFLVPNIWSRLGTVLSQFFLTFQNSLTLAPGDIMQGNVISAPLIPLR